MDLQKQAETTQTFADAFNESFAKSLGLRLEASWHVRCVEQATATKPLEDAIFYRLATAGGLQGEAFVAVERRHVGVLGSQLLKQAGAFDDPKAEALAEVLALAMEGLSPLLFTQFGEVTCKVDRLENVGVEEMPVITLAASCGDQEEIPILLYFGVQLSTSLSKSEDVLPPSKEQKESSDPTNLQLVMDVELNVSLRFGQCQLPLRDVLDLASGSVIELDRDVDDPVELLLDGKVIARGEAVIVDGNYGLRITEIPEPLASHFVR